MTDVATERSGQAMPQPGTYAIDASHSSLGFAARHLMVSKVRGRFTSFSGTLTVADRPEQSAVEVDIDTASIDTGDARRDEHLKGPDFLDVETYPRITFTSTGVSVTGDEGLAVTGDLTIRDQTHPVTLHATFEGVATDPWGGTRLGFEARTDIDRETWGLTWNMPLAGGGVVVGRKVQLELSVEVVKQ